MKNLFNDIGIDNRNYKFLFNESVGNYDWTSDVREKAMKTSTKNKEGVGWEDVGDFRRKMTEKRKSTGISYSEFGEKIIKKSLSEDNDGKIKSNEWESFKKSVNEKIKDFTQKNLKNPQNKYNKVRKDFRSIKVEELTGFIFDADKKAYEDRCKNLIYGLEFKIKNNPSLVKKESSFYYNGGGQINIEGGKSLYKFKGYSKLNSVNKKRIDDFIKENVKKLNEKKGDVYKAVNDGTLKVSESVKKKEIVLNHKFNEALITLKKLGHTVDWLDGGGDGGIWNTSLDANTGGAFRYSRSAPYSVYIDKLNDYGGDLTVVKSCKSEGEAYHLSKYMNGKIREMREKSGKLEKLNIESSLLKGTDGNWIRTGAKCYGTLKDKNSVILKIKGQYTKEIKLNGKNNKVWISGDEKKGVYATLKRDGDNIVFENYKEEVPELEEKTFEEVLALLDNKKLEDMFPKGTAEDQWTWGSNILKTIYGDNYYEKNIKNNKEARIKAVTKFQKKIGIEKSDVGTFGYFGEKSLAKLIERITNGDLEESDMDQDEGDNILDERSSTVFKKGYESPQIQERFEKENKQFATDTLPTLIKENTDLSEYIKVAGITEQSEPFLIVKKIQEFLIKNNLLQEGDDDGLFGNITRAAVEQLKKEVIIEDEDLVERMKIKAPEVIALEENTEIIPRVETSKEMISIRNKQALSVNIDHHPRKLRKRIEKGLKDLKEKDLNTLVSSGKVKNLYDLNVTFIPGVYPKVIFSEENEITFHDIANTGKTYIKGSVGFIEVEKEHEKGKFEYFLAKDGKKFDLDGKEIQEIYDIVENQDGLENAA